MQEVRGAITCLGPYSCLRARLRVANSDPCTHTQLASVFWEKIMIPALATGSPAALFVAFAIFSFFTIAVLLMMDLLECFLHALRLHCAACAARDPNLKNNIGG